jgi:hypothetical protein
MVYISMGTDEKRRCSWLCLVQAVGTAQAPAESEFIDAWKEKFFSKRCRVPIVSLLRLRGLLLLASTLEGP